MSEATTARDVRGDLLRQARALRDAHQKYYAPLGVTHTVYLDEARSLRSAARRLRGI